MEEPSPPKVSSWLLPSLDFWKLNIPQMETTHVYMLYMYLYTLNTKKDYSQLWPANLKALHNLYISYIANYMFSWLSNGKEHFCLIMHHFCLILQQLCATGTVIPFWVQRLTEEERVYVLAVPWGERLCLYFHP